MKIFNDIPSSMGSEFCEMVRGENDMNETIEPNDYERNQSFEVRKGGDMDDNFSEIVDIMNAHSNGKQKVMEDSEDDDDVLRKIE